MSERIRRELKHIDQALIERLIERGYLPDESAPVVEILIVREQEGMQQIKKTLELVRLGKSYSGILAQMNRKTRSIFSDAIAEQLNRTVVIVTDPEGDDVIKLGSFLAPDPKSLH